METKQIDLLWGPKAIGEAIGLSYFQAYRALERGDLPAKKVGRRWAASRDVLESFFKDAAA